MVYNMVYTQILQMTTTHNGVKYLKFDLEIETLKPDILYVQCMEWRCDNIEDNNGRS